MLSNTLKSTISAALLITGSVTVSASAQDQEKTFLYASYFSCPAGKMSDVSKVIKDQFAPLYDAAVKDGTLKDWGWSTHHTGGHWQLIFNHSNNTIDALLKSADTMNERGKAAKVDPENIFGKICNSHEDYIWELTQGATGEVEGPAALSTYYQCDISQEDRADEIVKTAFAQNFNANMGKGKLSSWAWASHSYGGKYRRGMWTSAANYTDLLKTMDAIFEANYGNDSKAGREFTQICSSHSDYLWNRH